MPKAPRFQPNPVRGNSARIVEVLAYPSVQLLDVTGPLQVFASANDHVAQAGGTPPYVLRVVAKGGQGVMATAGLGIATGPLLGGELGAISWRGPFFGTATLMAIGFVAIVVLLDRTPAPVDRPSLGAPLAALRHPGLLGLGLRECHFREVAQAAAIALRQREVGRERGFSGDEAHRTGERALDAVHFDLRVEPGDDRGHADRDPPLCPRRRLLYAPRG